MNTEVVHFLGPMTTNGHFNVVKGCAVARNCVEEVNLLVFVQNRILNRLAALVRSLGSPHSSGETVS